MPQNSFSQLKQMVTLILALCCLGSPVRAEVSRPFVAPTPPHLAVKAYVLMDHNSNHIIASYRGDKRIEPASITKMMTMYIIDQELKAGRLHEDDQVLISKNAWRAPGSRMFAQVNSQVPVRDLIRGIVVQSGNDASIALSEYIAGSEKAFVDLMNQQAHLMGLSDTHFHNVTGLPHKDHYTTATDMAKLAQAIIHDFPETYRIYSEKWFTYNGIKQPNRNRLLWRDPRVDGIKTGHTDSAGFCLVASAQDNDMRLISVIIGAKTDNERAEESQRLLNYGFRFFESHALYKANESLTSPRVWSGSADHLPLGLTETAYVTIPKGQYDQLKANITLKKHIDAPVAIGSQFGKLTVTLGDETLYEGDLVALETIDKGSLFHRFKDAIILSWNRFFGHETA